MTANEYAPEESAGIVLAIARYHRNSNGWNDIGYQFLVDKYGQVFEGRAGGIDKAVVGAQAQGWNSTSTGISCLGDFTAIAQTPEGLDALARLIGWKLSVHGIPTTARSPSSPRAARPTATRPARRSPSSASRATATATTRPARATCSTRSSTRCGERRRSTQARRRA